MPATVTGFPDYARLSNQAGQQLATINDTWHNNVATPAIDTTGFGYVDILWNTVGDTATGIVFITWFTDQALTQQVLVNQFMPVFSSFGVRQFPVIARWLKVQAFYETGPTTDTVLVSVFGSNAFYATARDDSDVIPPCRITQSIAASGEAVSTMGTTYNGPAVWTVVSNTTTNWKAFLEHYDWNTGTWQQLYTLYGARDGNSGIANVILPPCPVRMRVDNLDSTAAHFVFANIVI